MVSATDGSAFTGSVTCYVTVDGGTQAQGSVGSGACTHEGNGFHTYAPAQAETNGAHVAFTFTGSGAVPVTVQVYPLSYGSTGVMDSNVTQFGGSAGTFSGGRPETNTTHWGGTAVASAVVPANAVQISGDSTAADNLEAALDGSGGVTISADLAGTVGELGAQAKADVNNEVADVIKTDTIGDPAQGAPPLNASVQAMLNYIYRWLIRNKKTVDSSSDPTVEIVYADDETTELFKREISDAANVTTFDETVSGE